MTGLENAIERFRAPYEASMGNDGTKLEEDVVAALNDQANRGSSLLGALRTLQSSLLMEEMDDQVGAVDLAIEHASDTEARLERLCGAVLVVLERALVERRKARSRVGASAATSPTLRPADLKVPGLIKGAEAVSVLLRRLGSMSEEAMALSDEAQALTGCGDTRDYLAMAAAIDVYLEAHYVGAGAEHRTGMLLALAVLLCKEADSRFGAEEPPNPLLVAGEAMQARDAVARRGDRPREGGP